MRYGSGLVVRLLHCDRVYPYLIIDTLLFEEIPVTDGLLTLFLTNPALLPFSVCLSRDQITESSSQTMTLV